MSPPDHPADDHLDDQLDRAAESILYSPPPSVTACPQWHAQVAQLVEHATENRSVGGSIPPLGTISAQLFLAFMDWANFHWGVRNCWEATR